jgi:hypothetical protein
MNDAQETGLRAFGDAHAEHDNCTEGQLSQELLPKLVAELGPGTGTLLDRWQRRQQQSA